MIDTSSSGLLVPLDSEMHYILPQILNHVYLVTASKHMKIRIQSWLSRLEGIISNNIWRKNRNNYYKLLFIMLQCREISQPFTAMAPEDVPTLHRHQINCILTKLTTRLKEKERQKQNRQIKFLKTDPVELWNVLESNCNKNFSPSSIAPKPKTLTIETGAKQTNFDSVAFSYLSPISEAAHMRVNSNLSEGTLTTIQKCRDMLNNLNESNNQLLEIGDDKQSLKVAQSQVKYFQKNRNKQTSGYAINRGENKQELYLKIYRFLRKHQNHLQKDMEYREVMKQLANTLLIEEDEGACSQEKEEPPLEGMRRMGVEEDFSLVDIDEDSCDYESGKYSEYSSIQVDSGISPSRIKFLQNSQEGQAKVKNALSYRETCREGNGSRKGLQLHQC